MNYLFRNTLKVVQFDIPRFISSDHSLLFSNMPKKNLKKAGSSSLESKLSESNSKTEAVELDKHGNILINVHCKPGSTSNMIKGEISSPDQPRLDIKIHARAVEGQANTELVEFLAEILDIRKSDFTITHGLKSREKTLVVSTDKISLDQAKERINKEIALCMSKS